MRFLFLLPLCSALACGGHHGSTDAGSDDDASTDAGPADAGYQPTAAETAAFNTFLLNVKTLLADSHTPGASVAIVLHGQLAFAAGVGLKDTASNAAVTTSTLFRVASMSKMVLAATAMTLVDEGKLDLDAPITQYLPSFKLESGFDPTTLHMTNLLSHSSGFPCDTIGFCGTGTSGARQAFFDANPQPLWAAPGVTYDYSNAGFALAAGVIEAAAGESDGDYEQLAASRIFGPVGMTTATFDAATATAADHATGYVIDSNGSVTGTVEPESEACPMLDPPGGILATATDYAHFAEMMLANGGSVLQPSSVAAIESPHILMHSYADQSYGYALISQSPPYGDHPIVWHNGALDGYLSEMIMSPFDGFAVVALINASGGTASPDAICTDALPLFISTAESWPTGATPPSDWASYVGTYDDHFGTLGTGIQVFIDVDGGSTSLMVNAPNATDFDGTGMPFSGAMTQAADDTWVLPDEYNEGVSFFPGDAGTSGYFVTRRGTGVRE